MRIAVVGAGASGLVAAEALHAGHDVCVFEAASHAGGHARTVRAEVAGAAHAVDVGFVVFNETTYPNFVELLRRLGVASRPTVMSFGVSCERTGIEYCGSSLNTVFAQRRNLFRPSFLLMIRDILRFNRDATRLLATGFRSPTLGALLLEGGYSAAFRDRYLLPMGAAIWSADPARMLEFPAAFFVRFFENHGLLGVSSHLPWRTIEEGSHRYVEALTRPFADRIRVDTPVSAVTRQPDGVTVVPRGGPPERFDHVVLAVHADDALRILADATPLEREILGAFPYASNEGVLHTDSTLLPRARLARASWNYRIPAAAAGRVTLTYDMTRLQGLAASVPICVSLNAGESVAPERTLLRLRFEHPLFTQASVPAQQRHAEISGRARTHFCGAYWRNGFHEDAVWSGLRAARGLAP